MVQSLWRNDSVDFRFSVLALLLLAFGSGCSVDSPPTLTQTTSAAPSVSPDGGSSEEAPYQSEPLAEESATSSPRFVRLSSSQTGIDFAHEWNPPKEFEDRINSYAVGTGVSIGDIDGDGLADIFLACQSKGGRLYRNLGDWKFSDITTSANLHLDGFWATGSTLVDFDNDGDLDLYLCGFAAPNRMYVNQGDGTFVNEAAKLGIDYKGASVNGAFADYDNDGDLDMYLVTNHLPPLELIQIELVRDFTGRLTVPMEYEKYRYVLTPPKGAGAPRAVEGAEYDILFRNDGDDGFRDVTLNAGIGWHNYHGLSATWWDYDDDGDQDLYVANDFYGRDHLYRNNGDGTFQDVVRKVFPYIPWFSMGADAGDINNDGKLDLFAADMSSTTHYRGKVTMGDMDSDAWFLDHADPQQYMRNMLFINSGAGRFLESAMMSGVASTNWTWAVKFGDLDCDGWLDLFVTNGMTRDFQNSDLKNESLAKHKAKQIETPHEFWESLPELKEPNMAFQNDHKMHFKDVSKEWGLDFNGISLGASYGDLDNDGDPDLVVANFGEEAAVYRNDLANGKSRVKLRLIGTKSNRNALGSRVRLRAGGLEMVREISSTRGYMSSDETNLYFGLGDEDAVDEIEIQWASGNRQRFANLDVNRFYSFVEPDQSKEESATSPTEPLYQLVEDLPLKQHQENPFNDFSSQPLLPNRLSRLGPGIAVADVNGDGHDDFFIGGAARDSGALYLSTTDGYSAESDTFEQHSNCEDMGALLFDADGDGDQDLYVVSGGVANGSNLDWLSDRLYLNRGNGDFSFAEGVLPEVHDSGSCVVAADYDRDGDLDLFVGGRVVPGEYPVAPNSRILRNDSDKDGVRFVDATQDVSETILDAGMATGALWSDWNQDGWVDLFVTYEWGPVRLYMNVEGKLNDVTVDQGLSDQIGWWNGITGSDIDADGDVDYVVTNFGKNTKYHPSSKKPVKIYYADFEGNGKQNIVEAKVTKDGRLLPVRGRSCSSNAMPVVAERFATYHEFALAELADIYTPKCLDEAHSLEVNELRCGVYINEGDQGLVFKPLPDLAQISPGFGCVVTDANMDGSADLVLAQNFYGPQRETGRMAGGLGQLLLGDSSGEEWKCIGPTESGLIIPEDATSCAKLDLDRDGRDDLLVGINNGLPRAYRNSANSKDRPLRLRLKGPVGNELAIGATVLVESENGKQRAFEVYAGDSYLSQSSTVIAIGNVDPATVKVTVVWPDGSTSVVDSVEAVNRVVSISHSAD